MKTWIDPLVIVGGWAAVDSAAKFVDIKTTRFERQFHEAYGLGNFILYWPVVWEVNWR